MAVSLPGRATRNSPAADPAPPAATLSMAGLRIPSRGHHYCSRTGSLAAHGKATGPGMWSGATRAESAPGVAQPFWHTPGLS